MNRSLPEYRWSSVSLRRGAFAPRSCDHAVVERVRTLVKELAVRSESELKQMFSILAREVRQGTDPLELNVLGTTFALVSEAIRRALGIRYYDVQILAGVALAAGTITEMKTGEGKTIVAALPAALWALYGRGVHVATVNSYLAGRDYQQLLPAYQMLGLSVGLLEDGAGPPQKRVAYQTDITYGTGYEYGFDYLRDQSALLSQPKKRLGQRLREKLQERPTQVLGTVQRGLAFAIIDEVDSVLLDEANTPLIISASPEGASESARVYQAAAEVAQSLDATIHFIVQPRERTLSLTEAGHARLFSAGCAAPTSGLKRPWYVYVEQALRAALLMRLDVDYVIKDGAIVLVDQYTGRLFPDRTWQDGLHQAIECKEKVPITSEKRALARISRQRFYGLYERICGMTGTAVGHEREVFEFYRLPIVVIPDRVPSQRFQCPTCLAKSAEEKWDAIVDEVVGLHAAGRPVLVGTRSIQESEQIATRLRLAKIPFRLLNGKQDEEEATLVAKAGHRGAVTVATNMAGRGTDIKISQEVAELGGLHVIATQRQESRRVDRQLMGRAARQGDPGSCRFYVSPEDTLLENFGAEVASTLRSSGDRLRTEPQRVDALVARVQERAEGQQYIQRCELHRHDRWLNDVLAAIAERAEEAV